jgi:hypothetical protein
MAERASVPWRTCDRDGCTGIQLEAGGLRLAHALADERDAAN